VAQVRRSEGLTGLPGGHEVGRSQRPLPMVRAPPSGGP